MKTKTNFLIVLLLTVVFFSCKKSGNDANTTAPTNQKVVTAFLDKKIGNGQGIAATIAKGIKENLEYSKAWVNDYTNGEQIITIPIGNGYHFKNNADKNPNNYLVVFKDVSGVVRNGYIWQALSGATITKNTIANIYNHVDADLNGTYAMLNLKDNFMYQRKYENNKEKEFWIRQIEPSTNITNNTGVMVCTDYYVLHTTYNTETGEILNQEVTYTFQVCNCTPSNMVQTTIIGPGECDPNGDGGGGSDAACAQIQQDFEDEISCSSQPASSIVNASGAQDCIEKPFEKTWEVVTGLTWSVKANTSFKYKKCYPIGSPTRVIEVKNLKTNVMGYNGTEILTKTTWTLTGVNEDVLNNNTSNPSTHSVVTGSLKFECTGLASTFGVLGCLISERTKAISNYCDITFD